MARALSNLEYVTFLQEVQPDNLGLPDWGGVAQWGGEFVLMFKMPSGEWALSDITGGIPWGNPPTMIDAAAYLQSLPSYQPSWTTAFIYSIPANFMQTVGEYAADAGALAIGASKVLGSLFAAAIKPIADVFPLGPVLVAAVVILGLLYVPKPKSA